MCVCVHEHDKANSLQNPNIKYLQSAIYIPCSVGEHWGRENKIRLKSSLKWSRTSVRLGLPGICESIF